MNPTDPSLPTETEDAAATESAAASEDSAWVPTGADYASNRDFVDFPLSAETLKGIHEAGYKTATPVQSATIEPALAGRDMLVRAKTGTGKTVAFCVPIIERIEDGVREPRAVILAPTRELAQQIFDEATALAKYRDFAVVLLVGGVPMGPQDRALEGGATLVVGTPGRVLDHMRRKNLDLSKATVACLDEADEMLSMGFYEDVTTILDAMPKTAQILLFSATIGDQTEKIIRKYLKEPEQIRLSTDGDQVNGIEHVIYETPMGQHKVRSLLYLLDLENPQSAIIFCNTREDAATVASFLDRQGLDVQLMSGELPQARRTKVMKMVKAGVVRFLVATDVAARGIDISDLSHVLQYSLPQDPSIYLHRTGRTGRIGKKGTAISLISGSDIGTKKVLMNTHKIAFVEKTFPTPEECTQRRVDRQAAQIRDALGSIVFESYLPTAKALMTRPDGEQLIAAALRAFFQWDRTRRAEMAATEEPDADGNLVNEPFKLERKPLRTSEPRSEAKETREREPRERKPSSRGDRERKPRDRRDGPPPRGRKSAAPVDDLDLDALLVENTSESVKLDDLDLDAALAIEGAELAPPADDAAAKKKRRRRKPAKKKGEETGSEAADTSDDFDDDLLAVEETPAKREVPADDDLDSLLSID